MSFMIAQDELFAILMNKLSGSKSKIPMPKGFSTNVDRRSICEQSQKLYYSRGNTQISIPPPKNVKYFRTNQSYAIEINGDICGGSKYYCLRSIHDEDKCFNNNMLKGAMTFEADKNITILGVEVPPQIEKRDDEELVISSYVEILYAHLLNRDGTRLTHTHFSPRVDTNSLIEITFNRSIYIQKNKVYMYLISYLNHYKNVNLCILLRIICILI